MKNNLKVLVYVGLVLFILVFLFFVSNSSLFKQDLKNGNDKNVTLEQEESREPLFIISGEFLCLPLKDENQPHNDLCAFGIKDINSDYYRLQARTDEKFNLVATLEKGSKIKVSGFYIAEDSDTYQTLGTIEINEVELIDTEVDILDSNWPSIFVADYISFQNYILKSYTISEYKPTEFFVTDGEIDCEPTDQLSSQPLRLRKAEINGNKYCVGAFSEGAAGSTYTEYAYATVKGDRVHLMLFVARYPNCSNYPDDERIKCEEERENFNLDLLVDDVLSKESSGN